MSELKHHGIPGQKWGVQNGPPYPLSPEAKKGYNDFVDRVNKENSDDYDFAERIKKASIKNAGIEVGNNGKDKIKKGSSIYRIANSDESLDSNRKYAYLTKDDNDTFNEAFDSLYMDLSKPMSTYEYSAKKDISVADEKTVVEHLLKEYGDQKISDLYHDVSAVRDKSSLVSVKPKDKKEQMYLDYASVGANMVSDFFKNTMKENMDDVSDYFVKKGYDAIVDPEDKWFDFAQYPVILLNPKESLTLKEERKWR